MPTIDELAAWISTPTPLDASRRSSPTVAAFKHNLFRAWKNLSCTLDGYVQVLFDLGTGRSIVVRGCPCPCPRESTDDDAASSDALAAAEMYRFESGDLAWAPIVLLEECSVGMVLFHESSFREWRARFRLREDRVCAFVMRLATRAFIKLHGRGTLQSTGLRYFMPKGVTHRQLGDMMDDCACAYCRRSHARLRACSRCEGPKYCCVNCQKNDWRKGHRSVCTAHAESRVGV
jgi:hypothetical protein